MRKFLVIIIFYLVGLSGFSQEVEVLARLDTNAMLIGDHVAMVVRYSGPVNSQVIWPFLPDTILGNIIVIGRGKIDTTYTSDKKKITLSQELNITCYDSGFYTIPGIPFNYRNLPDTTRLSATTDMLLLAVHTVKVDTTQAIKPIKNPIKIPITFRELIPWILAIIAAIAVIIAVVWYLRKRKKAEPVFRLKPRVKMLPHELALQEFEKLRIKKLWQEGKIKEYHSELTEIIRKYIENQFNVPALELTSSELVENLKRDTGCPTGAIHKLEDILIKADLAKFAKSMPLPAENENSLNEGIEFVYLTTKTENVSTEKNAGD